MFKSTSKHQETTHWLTRWWAKRWVLAAALAEVKSSSSGSRRSAGSSGGGGLQLTTSTGERERKRGDGRGRQDINTPDVLYFKLYLFNYEYFMLAPITCAKNLNAEESIHVVYAPHSLAGLRHRPFPLVWQPQKCHQLDDIPIKAIFSGTPAPLMWGLNFHPTSVKKLFSLPSAARKRNRLTCQKSWLWNSRRPMFFTTPQGQP